jgi:hypothetical protein
MSTPLDFAKQKVNKVSRATIIDVIRVVVEAVEKDKSLKGTGARDAAVEVIELLIKDLASEDQEWLTDFVTSGMVECVIDTIIAASKGLYALNKKASARECILTCMGRD